MPESVTDRPTRAHEYVFLLTKCEHYWYDADAIREAAVYGENRATWAGGTERIAKANIVGGGHVPSDRGMDRPETTSRNKRDVWTVSTYAFPDAHFATFPPKLIEPMILAGCPVGGVVLDPFMGSGTTALVARQLGRNYLGCDVNADYVAMAERRLAEPFTVPMFEQAAANDR